MSHTQKLIASLAVIATISVISSHALAAATTVCSASVTPSISAGYAHTLAVKSDGSLGAWGKNNSGQLGDGTTTDSHVPKQILTGYTAIAAGRGPDTGYTVAVKSDGSLWAWGDNSAGQLGDGTTTASLNPKQIGSDTGYVSVMAGYYHSVALKSDGSLWAWGRNNHGQLGDGTTIDRLVPTQIGTDKSYTRIAVGESHTIALKSDGSLWAWGRNDSGQLGDGSVSDAPTPKMIGAGYSRIAAGKYYSVAIKSDNSLWAWGDNGAGQLGDGTVGVGRSSPRQVGSATSYTAIAAGFGHTVALTSSGDLWAWGNNLYGSLGDGGIVESLTPKLIGTGYTTIAAGNYHTVALKSDGSLWAWGDNGFGQVGDGTTTSPVTSPKTIAATGYATPDFSAPTAPSGFTARQAGVSANLTWTASNDNIGVQGYFVFRGSVLVGSSAAASYTDTGLAASTTYTYTLAAFDASCNISPSVSTTLTTSSDTQVPMVPADLKASPNPGSAGIDLTWTPSIDNIGVASYQVYRGSVLLSSQAQGNVTHYTDNSSSLIASTEYSYTVAACDAAGYCSAPSTPVSVITPQQLATNANTVTTLTAQSRTTGSVDLNWIASAPAATYHIYRDGALVRTTSTASYTDTGLLSSSSYSYTVAACDAAGYCSAQSTPVTVVTLQTPAISTATITSLSALPKTTTSIDLTWVAATLAATYNIYRNGALVGISSTTNYTDSGLFASSSYSYSVAACDAAGNCSAQSTPVTGVTLQNGATDPTQLLSDCLFNWAELNYSSLFAPRGSLSHSDGPYYWRAYSQTSAYLAVSAGRIYYLGPLSSNTALDLGATSTWYSTAGCQ